MIVIIVGSLAVACVICFAQYFLLTLAYRVSHKRAEAALYKERQEFSAYLDTLRPHKKGKA